MGFSPDCEAVTAIGWSEDQGRRDEMEDGFIFVDNYGGRSGSMYLGVYDGHGGTQTVEYLIKHLHVKLIENINKDSTSLAQCMRDTFMQVDEEMIINQNIQSSGATACVCIVNQDPSGKRVIHCAHVGDARAVLCRGGVAVRLTSESDHKATDPRELQRVIDCGGQVMNERVNGILAIARAFGDSVLKRPNQSDNVVSADPDVTFLEVDPETDLFMITACDGLWDVVDDQQAVNLLMDSIVALQTHDPEALSKKSLPELLARSLIEEALHRGTSDNVTVVVTIL